MKGKEKIISFVLFCTLVIISSCKGCDGCKGCNGCLCSSDKTSDTIEKAIDKTKKIIESDKLEKGIDGAKKIYKKIKK